MCFQMAIRATIFNQEKKTDDNVLLIYIIKRYLWSSINSLKNAFTEYVHTMFCNHHKRTDKTDDNTLHIYIFLGFL